MKIKSSKVNFICAKAMEFLGDGKQLTIKRKTIKQLMENGVDVKHWLFDEMEGLSGNYEGQAYLIYKKIPSCKKAKVFYDMFEDTYPHNFVVDIEGSEIEVEVIWMMIKWLLRHT